jgi:hypothetical protein
MAETGDDAGIELEVRVLPGAETDALAELRELGATGDVAGRGELRVRPGGPLRPVLAAERPLAFYAVRGLAGADLRAVDMDALMRASLALAGVVASLQRGKLRSYRVTSAPELAEQQRVVNQLSQQLGARLGVPRAVVQPDLVLLVRLAAGGVELAARLPRPGERPRSRPPPPDAPRRRPPSRPPRSRPR